ncbi:HNH endonuclease signature motif containing protein [Saccharopolyspora pogona]|uniref:HNH endonuclease signature motif containing protein n=1 Tax=Saccharopolyspora pogona TaxID=333966 RepID=UPI001CC235CA|nr:HNH endonuclease signature motif containing protein [Saccharopolyspora pogona]
MAPLTSIRDTASDITGPQSSVSSCSDAELVARIEGLERAMRVLMMQQLQVIAEADHRGVHAERGARSTQVWLQGLLNIDARDARARVSVARNVEDRQSLYGEVMPADLPETAAALAEGAIGLEHARVIVDGIRRLPGYSRCHHVGEVESTLAGYARTLPPRELEKLAERIRYVLDQDGAYDDEEAQHDARELHYCVARDGMTVIKARLDRETGAAFAALMQPLAAPRQEVDGEKDPRTGGQRPHMTIAIDFDDLKRDLGLIVEYDMPGTLNTERAITAENARRIACDAEVLPMVLDGDGLPLDVGRAKRTAPTHLRAALLQRDGVCAFPGCDRPPGTPEAHHAPLDRRWGDQVVEHGDALRASSPRPAQSALGHRDARRAPHVHPTAHGGLQTHTTTRRQSATRPTPRIPPGPHPRTTGPGGRTVTPAGRNASRRRATPGRSPRTAPRSGPVPRR